jgi:hypothetical protein
MTEDARNNDDQDNGAKEKEHIEKLAAPKTENAILRENGLMCAIRSFRPETLRRSE